MSSLLALPLVGTLVLLAGCTQPDGMPDPTHGGDPDNLVYYDESELAIFGGILATAVAAVAVRTWSTRGDPV